MAASFVISIFLSAALLFAVQPMVGRLVLPAMGGSPAVWNTVMVFFQLALLAGYALAHRIAHMKRSRNQVLAHTLVVLVALLLLPIGISAKHLAGSDAPALNLFMQLAIEIGPIALALGTMSPLLQRWYASLNLRRSEDPYFLYAASNAGSLIGLLGYPLLFEPTLGLSRQRIVWSIGFGLLVAVLLVIWIRLWRTKPVQHTAPESNSHRETSVHPLRWIVLALVPSSLLLGVTQHITTDVAAVPLLWAIPLALYLVTFILAFGGKTSGLLRVLSRVVPVLAVAAGVAVMIDAKHPLIVVVVLHLAAFFAIALACHARLAESRPPPAQLTRFYLCISLGGVLGGSINALLAPVLFNWVAEFPIMLALGAGLALGWPSWSRRTAIDIAPPALLIILLAIALLLVPAHWPYANIVLIGLPALACYLCSTQPLRFAMALLAVMLLPEFIRPSTDIIHRSRTFFGVHTVLNENSPRGPRHTLRHGGTLHGLQNVGSSESQTYYHTTGPIGQVVQRLPDQADIGAIGLGVGSIAALMRPGDRLTFHEIDPKVIRIASDPELFTFIRDSAADVDFVIGDGRLTIAGAPPKDLIIVDAFTSDAIPVHLLTVEALQVYAAHLRNEGLIAMHLSNRYLDLAPVLAANAKAAGLTARIQTDYPNTTHINDGKQISTWAILANEPGTLAPFADWDPLTTTEQIRPWTDDYANILSVLRLD